MWTPVTEPGARAMSMTIEAIYENGVLKPTKPLPLAEHEQVQVTIHTSANWVQDTAGLLGWQGTSEELAAFALDPEYEYPPAPEEP